MDLDDKDTRIIIEKLIEAKNIKEFVKWIQGMGKAESNIGSDPLYENFKEEVKLRSENTKWEDVNKLKLIRKSFEEIDSSYNEMKIPINKIMFSTSFFSASFKDLLNIHTRFLNELIGELI